MPGKKATGWGACKEVLRDWAKPGVLGLLQELYELNSENRQFIEGRLLAGRSIQASVAVLDGAKKKLAQTVALRNIYADRFRHADMKRIVDQFFKATQDVAGVGDLLVWDLDVSLKTFLEIGSYEPIVDHVYAVMKRLHELLETLYDLEAKKRIVGQLVEVGRRYHNKFGYGISDELYGMAEEWREHVEKLSAENDATEEKGRPTPDF